MIRDEFIGNLDRCLDNKDELYAIHIYGTYVRLIDKNNNFICGDMPLGYDKLFMDLVANGFEKLDNNVYVSYSVLHMVVNVRVNIVSNRINHITTNDATRILLLNGYRYIISNTEMFGYTLLYLNDNDYTLDYTDSNFNIIDEL